MLTRVLHRSIPGLLILFFAAIQLSAQIELGSYRYRYDPAPVLEETTGVVVGVKQRTYLQNIGGVAFSSVAQPTPGLSFRAIDLKYDDQRPDGSRLLLTINGREVNAATMVLRYAAFFRYVKENHAASWSAFMREIQNVDVLPKVRTPTVMLPLESNDK